MATEDKPQDITCSGGIKLNLGVALGRPPVTGEDNGDDDDTAA